MDSLRSWAFIVVFGPAILACGGGKSGSSGQAGGSSQAGGSVQAGGSAGQSASTNAGGSSGGKIASAGAGGSTGTSKATGPAISSAPAAWERPADCGGIGDTCPNGIFDCTGRSVCQLEGYLCIPAYQGSMPGKSAERPYCAAYTCMTYEEASCFCTGAAAAKVRGCASPSQLAGLCVGQGSTCTGTTTCCPGLSCVNGIGTAKLCEQKCTSNADCQTGCCTDLRDTGDMICAPASACTKVCKKTGEACDPGSMSTPNNCCQGDCVNSTNPNYTGCRQACTKDTDCVKTGCCTLYDNSTRGFCVDSRFCTCGTEGAACGDNNTSLCCKDTHCSKFSADLTFKCYKACTASSECPSQCCVALSDGSARICAPDKNYTCL